LPDEIEAINVRRIERLVELAHLRNTPPETLMGQLGIKARGVCLSHASRSGCASS